MSETRLGRGRPRKILDSDKIARMIGKGFTVEFVADFFDVHVDTLYVNYSDALRKGYVFRNGCLQAKQFHNAMHGNTTMQIWLGKQWLKQTEKIVTESAQGNEIGFGDSPRPNTTDASHLIQ